MPTIRISEHNFRRLQRFAIPLEDTADDVVGRVLAIAESARELGMLEAPAVTDAEGEAVRAETDRLDIRLAARLVGFAVPTVVGKSMTRWETRGKGTRFWVTTTGGQRVYLPRRGDYPSDTDHKVVHHANPTNGFDRYDHLFLREEGDIEYALRVLKDLDQGDV